MSLDGLRINTKVCPHSGPVPLTPRQRLVLMDAPVQIVICTNTALQSSRVRIQACISSNLSPGYTIYHIAQQSCLPISYRLSWLYRSHSTWGWKNKRSEGFLLNLTNSLIVSSPPTLFTMFITSGQMKVTVSWGRGIDFDVNEGWLWLQWRLSVCLSGFQKLSILMLSLSPSFVLYSCSVAEVFPVQ